MYPRFNILFFLSIISFQFSFGQNANELNEQSKKLIQQGNYKEAFPLVKRSAELGNAEAQYNYGFFLQSGVAGNKNEKDAVKWFRKSSENGFNDGHYAMMMAYGNGIGIEQNAEKAFIYALKCAENNDPTCMWNIVNCYLTGNGVKPNITKFKEWLLKLAKLPNPENIKANAYITSARLMLAHFCKKGEHFKKDNYHSYLWYLIYNESKSDFSLLKQDQVIQEIKELEALLSKEQIENAGKDAEKLLGRTLTNINKLHKNTL